MLSAPLFLVSMRLFHWMRLKTICLSLEPMIASCAILFCRKKAENHCWEYHQLQTCFLHPSQLKKAQKHSRSVYFLILIEIWVDLGFLDIPYFLLIQITSISLFLFLKKKGFNYMFLIKFDDKWTSFTQSTNMLNWHC